MRDQTRQEPINRQRGKTPSSQKLKVHAQLRYDNMSFEVLDIMADIMKDDRPKTGKCLEMLSNTAHGDSISDVTNDCTSILKVMIRPHDDVLGREKGVPSILLDSLVALLSYAYQGHGF